MSAEHLRTLYLAERVMPNMTADDLAAIQHALAEAAWRTTVSGRPVQYVRAIYVASQRRWMGLFAAADEDAVRAALRLAQLPFLVVERVTDLPIPGLEHAHQRS
jgi:uncharacterized protein DUF4242